LTNRNSYIILYRTV